MPENITPINSDSRLEKLLYYEILNSPAENTYDNISWLAAAIFEVENAGICFITNDDIFIKSQVGKKIELSKNDSFLSPEYLKDGSVTRNNIARSDEPAKYIAVPIKSPDYFIIGALYVFGNITAEPTEKQKEMLSKLAELVIDKLETRIAIRQTLTAQDDRLHVLIHDLKNPMTTISLQSELVSRMPNIDEKAGLIASKINLQSKKMVGSLNEILSSAKKVSGSFKPQKNKIDLREVLNAVSQKLAPLANKKNQNFDIKINSALEIFGDDEKITKLFYHILHNSIKFSPENRSITLLHQQEENLITIAVKDEGVGLNDIDLERLFIKFADLSAVPTHGENSNGLGLTAVKMFVDMHKGKIWAESEGKNKGTTFFVQLPIK